MKDFRQQAKDLVNLATDERTPEKERTAAMVQAIRVIKQHDLLSSPLDRLLNTDNETVNAAATLFGRLTDPDFVDSVRQVARGLSSRRGGSGKAATGGRRR